MDKTEERRKIIVREKVIPQFRYLIIKNIGLLQNVEVKISGLTVIAGENDTGKSTIGKVLFALIKACEMTRGGYFYKNRQRYILKQIDKFKDSLQYAVRTKKEYDKLAQAVNNFKKNVEKILIGYLAEGARLTIVRKEIEKLKKSFPEDIEILINNFSRDIEECFLDKFRNKFRKNTFENLLSYIFAGEFCSKFSREESIIKLISPSKKTEARIREDKVVFLRDGGTFLRMLHILTRR